MSKWILLSVPCLTCLSFLAAGARPRQSRDAALVAADAQFVPTPSIGSANKTVQIDGKGVLDEARAKLREVRWLRATIWQRCHDRDHPYESTARLVLGPDQCARMETTLRAGAASCQQLLVSDGRVLAEVERLAGAPEKISGCHLPGPETGAVREQFLRRRGCAGPLPLLQELQTSVRDWQVQHGAWCDRPVLRLEGTSRPGRGDGDAAAARCCRIYIDAVSHLPLRLEWFKNDDPQRSPLVLEMEYRDLELNHALSSVECAQAFTYVPRR